MVQQCALLFTLPLVVPEVDVGGVVLLDKNIARALELPFLIEDEDSYALIYVKEAHFDMDVYKRGRGNVVCDAQRYPIFAEWSRGRVTQARQLAGNRKNHYIII